MANSLGRDIEENEIVIIDKYQFGFMMHNPYERLFIVHSGFGRRNTARGSAIFGWDARKENGKVILETEVRRDGWDINKEETERFQKEHFRFYKMEANNERNN